MSLNAEERELTSTELRANPRLSGLTVDDVARGAEPQPYTYLSEQMRAAPSVWFPLRDAPEVGRSH